jgi:hypothetical protein
MAGSGAGATGRVVGRGRADSTVQQTDVAPGRRLDDAHGPAAAPAGTARLHGRRRRLPAVPVDRWPAGGSRYDTNNGGTGFHPDQCGYPSVSGGSRHPETVGVTSHFAAVKPGSVNAGVRTAPGDPGSNHAGLGDSSGSSTNSHTGRGSNAGIHTAHRDRCSSHARFGDSSCSTAITHAGTNAGGTSNTGRCAPDRGRRWGCPDRVADLPGDSAAPGDRLSTRLDGG